MALRHGLREGSRGPEVVRLQAILNGLGIPAGAEDGIYGYRTKRAVSELQRIMGLRPDGIVGRRTRAVLNKGQLPVRLHVHTARKGETLGSAARHMGADPRAVARANRVPPRKDHAFEEGSPVFGLGRMLLGVNWGYLPPVAEPWQGWHTGAVFEMNGEGALVGGGPSLGSTGMPLIVLRDHAVLGTAERVKTGIAAIKELIGAEPGLRGMMLVLPRAGSALSIGFLPIVDGVRKALGRNRPLLLGLPVLEARRRGGPGKPVMDVRKALNHADYVVLMAWRDSVFTGSDGFIAPLPWVTRTLRESLSGAETCRVLLGVCGACVRRDGSGEPQVIPYEKAGRAMRIFASGPTWDMDAQQPGFSYVRRGVEARFAFENDGSIKLKAMAADRLNLGGLAVFDCAWAHPDVQSRVGEVFMVTPPGEYGSFRA